MKRSTAKKEILKVLKTWENCRMEMKTAEEVLSKLEELGMEPPVTWIDSAMPGLMVRGNKWDEETKRSKK